MHWRPYCRASSLNTLQHSSNYWLIKIGVVMSTNCVIMTPMSSMIIKKELVSVQFTVFNLGLSQNIHCDWYAHSLRNHRPADWRRWITSIASISVKKKGSGNSSKPHLRLQGLWQSSRPPTANVKATCE